MKSIRKKIGDFFRTHRLKNGLDQFTVAQQLKLSSSKEMQDYETGKKDLPLDLVFELTNLYNIPPDEVVVLFYELALSRPSLSVVEKSR